MRAGNMAQQSHSLCVGKYLFSDPCEWLMMGKCPWQLNILSEKIARFVQFNRQEYSMSQQISLLRQRLIDDMTIRNMSPLTQKAYVRAVKNFSKHFGKSPDQLTFEHVREYRLHLGSRGLGVQATNQIMCGLRFFYGTTLGKAAVSEQIPLGRRHDALTPFLREMKLSAS